MAEPPMQTPRTLLRRFMDDASPHSTPLAFKQTERAGMADQPATRELMI